MTQMQRGVRYWSQHRRSSDLLLSPGLETKIGSSKRSPGTRRDVQRDVVGGEDEGGGEGGGGWGESCWRTPPLGDSVSCRWAPVEGKHNSTSGTTITSGKKCTANCY